MSWPGLAASSRSRGSGESGINRTTVALPSGRTWFTAVTSGVGRAVLGATTEVNAMAAVRDLQARRYGTGIQLSWDWPDRLSRVSGRMASSREPGPGGRSGDMRGLGIPQPRRLPGRARPRSGHRVGPGHLRTPAGLIESAAQEAEVPGADVIVWYRFQPPRRWPPGRRARLVLTASQTCELPTLVVVRDEEGPGGGEPVFRTRAMSLAQAQPAHVPVPTWRPGDQLACALGGDQSGVSLVRCGDAP